MIIYHECLMSLMDFSNLLDVSFVIALLTNIQVRENRLNFKNTRLINGFCEMQNIALMLICNY